MPAYEQGLSRFSTYFNTLIYPKTAIADNIDAYLHQLSQTSPAGEDDPAGQHQSEHHQSHVPAGS